MSDLNHVQQGEPIRAEDWNKIVDAINSTPNVTISRGQCVPQGLKVALFSRKGAAWSLDSASGMYRCVARMMVVSPTTGKYVADTSVDYDVYSPYTNVATNTTLSKFHAVKRNGRWECVLCKTDVPEYKGGDGIEVYSATEGGWYEIENKGVVNVKVRGDSYADRGTLNLASGSFEWVSSAVDTVGKYDLAVLGHNKYLVTAIETEDVSVVTGISYDSEGKLSVTRKTVKVIKSVTRENELLLGRG